MRSPDTKALDATVLYGTFSAAQWQTIKADLAAVDIDLDAAKLPSMPNKPWWLPGDAPLRDALQFVAWYHGALAHLQWKPPTSLQRAEELQESLNLFETARARIWWGVADDYLHAQARARREHKHDLHAAMTQEIADLQECVAALKAKGKTSTGNPKNIHNEYWRELTRLWLAFKPNVSRRDQRGHLRRFLFHCSASLFADVPKIESKIAAFVSHLFTSKRSPK